MTALRYVVVGLAMNLACASDAGWTRRHLLLPPARESRVGAREKGADPVPGEGRTAQRPPTPRPGGTPIDGPPAVVRAVTAASSLVGRRDVVIDGVNYGPGCAALVRAAFACAGHALPPDVRDAHALHAHVIAHGALNRTIRPAPGDLVFLADRPGGPPSHVGMVSRVEPDGTAFVLHRLARGILPVRINLAYPERPTDPATGRQINDTLVVNARPVSAGSLVVGVSDLLRRGAKILPTASVREPPSDDRG